MTSDSRRDLRALLLVLGLGAALCAGAAVLHAQPGAGRATQLTTAGEQRAA